MAVDCWFYRSFANSFTLCLICLARAARVAAGCRLPAFGFRLSAFGCWLLAVGCWLLAVGCWLRLFYPLPAGCGLMGQRMQNNDCSFPCPLSTPGQPALTEKKDKKLSAVLETQKKRSSRA